MWAAKHRPLLTLLVIYRFIFRSWNMKQRTKKKTFLFEMLKIVRLSFVEIVLHLLLKMPKIRLSKWKNVSLVQLWSGSFSSFRQLTGMIRIIPNMHFRIPTVKLKIPGKLFFKVESRNSVTFKL